MAPSGGKSDNSSEARIGEVLRRLREEQGLSLRTLAVRVGFSASFLSQVENGAVSPSISSLERIAGELGVTLADLFVASQPPATAVIRAHARSGFTSDWSHARIESLTPALEHRRINAVLVTLASGGLSGKQPSTSPTEQFGYVLQGSVCLFLPDERIEMETGDAVVIPTRALHRWENQSPAPAQILLVSLRLFP